MLRSVLGRSSPAAGRAGAAAWPAGGRARFETPSPLLRASSVAPARPLASTVNRAPLCSVERVSYALPFAGPSPREAIAALAGALGPLHGASRALSIIEASTARRRAGDLLESAETARWRVSNGALRRLLFTS
jgi:hypothetical protein